LVRLAAANSSDNSVRNSSKHRQNCPYAAR
jgi:hypothetical protein